MASTNWCIGWQQPSTCSLQVVSQLISCFQTQMSAASIYISACCAGGTRVSRQMLTATVCARLAGVLLNTVLADWLITFLLTALLLLMTYRTLRKSWSLHQVSWQRSAVLVYRGHLVVCPCMIWFQPFYALTCSPCAVLTRSAFPTWWSSLTSGVARKYSALSITSGQSGRQPILHSLYPEGPRFSACRQRSVQRNRSQPQPVPRCQVRTVRTRRQQITRHGTSHWLDHLRSELGAGETRLRPTPEPSGDGLARRQVSSVCHSNLSTLIFSF